MGENSGIAWTTHTFNPWVGCQRVSPECEHCYAEAYDKRVGGARLPDGTKSLRWGPRAPRVRTSPANWRQPLKWNKAAAAAGRRDRVFCSSLADVFEDRRELAPWRLELLEMISATPHLDWLLLTKRPENVRRLLSACIDDSTTTPWHTGAVVDWLQRWMDDAPPSNLWLGTTVEDQRRAEERIPALLAVPAAVRFLSCEPLLEAVDLRRWLRVERPGDGKGMGGGLSSGHPALDWVIIGGESGPGAREFHTDWARDLVEDCRKAGAASFVKQLGTNAVASGRDQLALLAMTDHGDVEQFPEDLRVREFPIGDAR